MVERVPTSIPLEIDAIWRTRFWTTTPPIYVPHTEWTLKVKVDAATPIRLARVDHFETESFIWKASPRPRPAYANDPTYFVATIPPTETEPSRTALDAPWTALRVDPQVDAATWSLIPVLKDSDGTIRRSIIIFPRQDTDGLRAGRWRVRESLREYLPIRSLAFERGITRAPGELPR